MLLQITSRETSEYSDSLEIETEKKSAFISLSYDGRVNVLCKNASHSAWRGMGRFFDSFEDAKNGYKSSAMKVMIETAEETLVAPIDNPAQFARFGGHLSSHNRRESNDQQRGNQNHVSSKGQSIFE